MKTVGIWIFVRNQMANMFDRKMNECIGSFVLSRSAVPRQMGNRWCTECNNCPPYDAVLNDGALRYEWMIFYKNSNSLYSTSAPTSEVKSGHTTNHASDGNYWMNFTLPINWIELIASQTHTHTWNVYPIEILQRAAPSCPINLAIYRMLACEWYGKLYEM